MLSVRHFVLITLVSASSAAVLAGCDDTKPAAATGADGSASGGTTGAGGTVATGGTTGAGGTTGTGGAVATGGTTGAGGTTPGGDAGTPPASGCMIPCIVALTKDCVPSGVCMEATAGTTSNRCYANGVKVGTSLTIALPPIFNVTTKKPDGSVCYTASGMLTGASASLVFKNAAGQQIGTGTYDGTNATVMCDGANFDPASVASCASVLSLPSIPGSTSPSGSCSAGACTP
jgi:hypothetical protein